MSRRRLLGGVPVAALGGLLAACGRSARGPAGTPTPVAALPTAPASGDLAQLFAGASSCSLTPATTQGPYHLGALIFRSDIREDRDGMPLRLVFKVQDGESCAPLRNAVVEVWHCDALGRYSGAGARSAAGGAEGSPLATRVPGTPDAVPVPPVSPGGSQPASAAPSTLVPSAADLPDLRPTDRRRYLRGAQEADLDGIAAFTTVWPGWYRGRTIHVHVMVHVGAARALTTQLMFDDQLNDQVLALPAYAGRGERDTTNATDPVFQPSMLVRTVPDGDGYLAAVTLTAGGDRGGR
jgi:protocatechuate 3,4-dioxygenase beta subunit